MRTRVMATLRRYLIAGLLVWIPLAITLWVLALVVELMDQSLLIVPARFRSDALLGFHLPGLGAILTLAILLATGAIAANFFGRRMLAFPAHPRYSRMLLAAQEYGCVHQACLVAALTQGRDLLMRGGGKEVRDDREDLRLRGCQPALPRRRPLRVPEDQRDLGQPRDDPLRGGRGIDRGCRGLAGHGPR